MTATTTTTIHGVSILSGQKQRGDDAFVIVLSHEGIEVRRPDRAARLMSWDRVSEWEIEERTGYVLLTLRGPGATTPLVVPGWTLDDLEVLMRDVTSTAPTAGPEGPEPIAPDMDATIAATVAATPSEPPPASSEPAPEAPVSNATAVAGPPDAATGTRRNRDSAHRARQRRLSWKVPVTVVLLGLLATAVVVVLLQSAGLIDWSFLGPVA